VERFFNWGLAKEPLNWAIVFVIATIWLLCFHVIMQGFQALQGGKKPQKAIGGNPGQIASIQSNSAFDPANTLTSSVSSDLMASYISAWGFDGVSDGVWTDGFEAKYASDGWLANS
jgi:hypothetical protein